MTKATRGARDDPDPVGVVGGRREAWSWSSGMSIGELTGAGGAARACGAGWQVAGSTHGDACRGSERSSPPPSAWRWRGPCAPSRRAGSPARCCATGSATRASSSTRETLRSCRRSAPQCCGGCTKATRRGMIQRHLVGVPQVVELGASLGITGVHVVLALAADGRYLGVEANPALDPQSAPRHTRRSPWHA